MGPACRKLREDDKRKQSRPMQIKRPTKFPGHRTQIKISILTKLIYIQIQCKSNQNLAAFLADINKLILKCHRTFIFKEKGWKKPLNLNCPEMKADTYCHVKYHNHLGTFLNSYFPMSGVTEFE